MGGRSRAAASVALLCSGALAACSQVQSKDIRTSGIGAVTQVTMVDGGSGGLDVSVDLRTGSLQTVDLGDGDELTATVDGTRHELEHSEAFAQDAYGTHFDGTFRGGETVTVSLRRGPDDTSAPRSTVRLPGPFRVSAPAAGSTQRRSADLRIATDPGGDGYAVGWRGSCITTGTTEGDPDPLLVRRDRIVQRDPVTSGNTVSRAPASCDVTLDVERVSTGQLDPAFKEGKIIAVRPAPVRVRSVP